MRQLMQATYIKELVTRSRTALIMILLLLTSRGMLFADIDGLTLTVDTNPAYATGLKFNTGVTITLQAAWTRGDTPPFGATFNTGGSAIGTVNTTDKQAQFITTGASLGSGDKDFSVLVVETSVPNAISKTAVGNRTVSIDTTTPNITVTLDNGSTFSNQAPNNVVKFTVRSDKDVAGTPNVTVSPSSGATLAQDGTPTSREFKYTITLSGAATGQYTIRAICKDTTQPAETANSGSGQNAFNVNNTAPTSPSIVQVLPQSPTNLSSITLKGTYPSPIQSVAIYEGGTKVVDATVDAANMTWTAALTNVTEGSHRYTAKGKDALGNESPSSSEFEVIVDQTQPATPHLNQPPTPTSMNPITITGTGAVDSGTIKSLPILVRLYNMSGAIASVTANADGSFTFTNITLSAGDNIFYARAEDNAKGTAGTNGNMSETSAAIHVVLDTSTPTVTGVMISQLPDLASTSLPIAAGTFLGTGDYAVQVIYNKDMNQTITPQIGVKPNGGAETAFSGGSWVASNTFIGKISIPAGQGTTWDGAGTLRIANAKDAAGNLQTEYSMANAFNIDTTAPTTAMDSMDDIYISSNTTSITLRGTSTDSGSGVGYVEIATAPFSGTPPTSGLRVPVLAGSNVNWSYIWDVSALPTGKYKLWAYAADQAKPNANIEAKTNYRTVIVSKSAPGVVRISLDDEINDLPTTTIISVASDVTKITAVAADGGGAGLNLGVPPTLLTLMHDASGKNITGNFNNNGIDTIYFTFPKLTDNGTYTISFMPIDKAGNPAAAVATRSFILDTSAPDDVIFMPGNGMYVNETYPPIQADQVWALINDPLADYAKSTIEVSYNGTTVGNQVANGSTTAVIWDLYGSTASAPSDQSGDGRYDVTVVPKDLNGNTGASKRSHFYLDTQGPAVTALSNASGSWIGLDNKILTLTMSDAPADQVKYHGAKTAADASWQNGSGSGVNAFVSTYTATLNGTVASATAQSDTTLALNRPDAPSANEGVASMAMHAELADKVPNSAPNVRTLNFEYFFDYKRPSFTFTKPTANAKYCKTTLAVEASTLDRGTASTLQITKAEVTDAAGNWTSMTNTPPLPSNPSTGTIVLDISSWADGTHSIKGHCFDRGNNLSSVDESSENGADSEVQIVVDRTPPAAPTLILPLNDSASKLRSQRFKWSQQTDADHYLIQVADDSAFNNILNNLSNTYGLTGQVTTTNEAAFTAPKDGMYYWRVAAIETCADGYNISSYSTTFHFLVDSVKPKVVSVQPTPSTGSKITTGMVTFTIRFNEKLDATIPLTVTLTTAGGQAMQIEQVDCKEDTWTGTTVIPKDSSAIYDGNAVIAISGAKDLAGNEMETDSTHIVVINTGPAFEIKIFSNPAHEYEITIIARATEALQSAPTCSVTQGGSPKPVVMNFLKEKYYAGSYRIDPEQPGKAYIDVTGTDLQGMIGKGSVQFTVANLTSESRLSLMTPDGLAKLDIATGTVVQKSGIYMLSRDDLDTDGAKSPLAKIMPSLFKNAVANSNVSELVEVMPLEELGPSSLRLSRRIWYTAWVKDLKLTVPPEKVHLYRQVNGKWIFVGGTIKNEQVVAQLGGLGKLALMADLKAPQLANLSPSDRTKLEDPQPTIEGVLSDSGAGIETESLKVLIDGIEQPDVVLGSDCAFSCALKRPLAKGEHSIEITAADKAGNIVRQQLSVEAPGPFGIHQLISYPNPARGNSLYITYDLEQKPDELSLTIYDVSGAKVDKFDLIDICGSKASGKMRWDLTNRDGKRVANGVYIYKLEATKNGKTVKSRGKLAVLR